MTKSELRLPSFATTSVNLDRVIDTRNTSSLSRYRFPPFSHRTICQVPVTSVPASGRRCVFGSGAGAKPSRATLTAISRTRVRMPWLLAAAGSPPDAPQHEAIQGPAREVRRALLDVSAAVENHG